MRGITGWSRWLAREALSAATAFLTLAGILTLVSLALGREYESGDTRDLFVSQHWIGLLQIFSLMGVAFIPASVPLRAGRVLPVSSGRLMMAMLAIPAVTALCSTAVLVYLDQTYRDPTFSGAWLVFMLGACCLLRTTVIALSAGTVSWVMPLLFFMPAFSGFHKYDAANPPALLLIGGGLGVAALIWLRWLLTRSTAPFSSTNFFAAQQARQFAQGGRGA